MHSLMFLALLPALSGAVGTADEIATERLFAQALAARGDEYVTIRTQLLARDDLPATLKSLRESATDWPTHVLADALTGWQQNPELYRELWNYKPPGNMRRNPFPAMRGEALRRFDREGRPVAPLLLELIWKKRETLHGALPDLVAKWQLERGLPVLMTGFDERRNPVSRAVSEAIGTYGERATPLLIEAIPESIDDERLLLIVQALGHTGDQHAIPPLITLLERDADGLLTEAIARALAELKAYATLRDHLALDPAPLIRRPLIRALRGDPSDETFASLLSLANSESPADLRVEAFRVALAHPSDERLAALCRLLAEESETQARESMVIVLDTASRFQKHDVVRDALLDRLQDPADAVKARALEALLGFEGETVTGKLLPFAASEERLLRRAALYSLQRRKDDRIPPAFLPLLTHEDRETRWYVLDALALNPVAEAIEPVGQLLLTCDDEVLRNRAALTLGKLGGEKSLALLQQALAAESSDMVKGTLEAEIRSLLSPDRDR